MARARSESPTRTRGRRDPRAEPDAPEREGIPVVEEVVHTARRDPRAEPDSDEQRLPEDDLDQEPEPRARQDSSATHDTPVSGREVALGDAAHAAEAIATEEPKEVAAQGRAPASEPAPISSTLRDPRFAAVEPLIATNAWGAILDRLGPPQQAGELPPGLALVCALAQREAGEANAAAANALAIDSMASLLGIPKQSHTALLLAKRLLRQMPAAGRAAQPEAPPAGFSWPTLVIAIVLGLAVGWLASRSAGRLF